MVRKIALLIAGTLLIIVGIIAVFIPIVPQITPIVAGLTLIGYANPRVRRAVEPVIRRCEVGVRKFADRLLRRIRRR